MNKLVRFIRKIDWIILGFLVLTPLIAATGVFFLAKYDAIRVPTVLFSLFYMVATGLAMTAGYHRLFSHRSYVASRFVKFLLLLLGCASFENSARMWASDHRNHHKFVDTERDPYNIKNGFWYAHIGWVFLKRNSLDSSNIVDLDADPLVRAQHRYYFVMSFVMGFAFPMAVAALWGDALGGLLLAGFLRIALNHHFTFSINSFCHKIGKQPYSDQNSSRDSWIPALLTYGEGYHNYHHTFPADYRNAIRAYQWDPTKWFIRTLAWMGHASALRQMSDKKILEVRVRMDEKKLLEKVAAGEKPHLEHEFIAATRTKLEAAFARFYAMRDEYQKTKQAKLAQPHHARATWHEGLETLKRDLNQTKKEFEDALLSWKRLTLSSPSEPFSAS